MTCIASILDGLIAAIDGFTASVLTATVAEIEAASGKTTRKHN